MNWTVGLSPRGRGALFPLLLILLLVPGCGGGHKTTGATTGSATPSNFDFGSNDALRADAFGDSITEGALGGSFGTTANNYPNILQSMLRGLNPSWRVTNRGLGGEEVQDGARRLPGVLAGDRPGFVLLMEGTNNASHLDDPAFIVANLQAMVNQARANKTIPVLGTIPPDFRTPSIAPYIQETINQSNTMIRTMAASQGVVLAEIFDGMNTRSLFGVTPDEDPLHPNEQGYAVMAGLWFNAMQVAIPHGSLALRTKRRK